MKVASTQTARDHIAGQLAYLINRGALAPAGRLRERIQLFIHDFLCRYPRASRYIEERDLFESWIPRTPYVVLYRIDSATDTLIVLALFHSAQDRSQFTP